jgi:hypothetical protein
MTFLLHPIVLTVMVNLILGLLHPHIVSVNIASVGEVMNPTDPAVFVKMMFYSRICNFSVR